MHLDPVLLEIMRAKVEAAAEEMSTTLQRTARTLYVKEAADFATALTDLSGRFFAYPPTAGVTIFIDNDCGPTIRAMPDLEEGDVIVTNDVYRSQGLSTHLPDIHMIRPYFWKGKLVCYGWCFIHSTDVGGKVPSSISPSNHEIFQEGLIIPPMKIVKKGVFNDGFERVFTANCRTPEANMGDIKAMLGSLHTGQERVNDIIGRHGLGVFMTCQEDLQAYSETKARAVISRVPDGDYEFWERLIPLAPVGSTGHQPRCYARSGATRLRPRQSALSRPTTRSPRQLRSPLCVTATLPGRRSGQQHPGPHSG